jgi:ABC-type sulfate transport system permease subunit
MMILDWIAAFISALVFFIYGTICFVSILFTFHIEKYHKMEEALNVDLITTRILTPLEMNIDVIDSWLIDNRKIVGPILIFLSLIDIKLSFDILKTLSF